MHKPGQLLRPAATGTWLTKLETIEANLPARQGATNLSRRLGVGQKEAGTGDEMYKLHVMDATGGTALQTEDYGNK